MSDNEKAQPNIVGILIQYDPQTKDLQVQAPSDMVLVLGMMEMAKLAIAENHRAAQLEKSPPRIMVPKIGMN